MTDARFSDSPTVPAVSAAESVELVAVSAGMSEDSTTDRLAARMLAEAASVIEARGLRVRTTHVRLRELARHLADLTATGLPAPQVEEAFAAVRRASGVLTVAPVYKAAPVGILTLFWQLIDDASLASTPVLLGSTGGTPRHSLAAETTLRPLLAYLKGIVLPTAVFAATDDWGAGAASGLRERITAAAEEFAALVVPAGTDAEASEAFAAEPAPSASVRTSARLDRMRDEFDPESVTPFAQLLGR
ncbi:MULTISPECIES: CE1759 family FMN reductase [Brevibacterium]|uniref:NADPH-dependent FMN reductase-like domain-containing protein n=1 Tax=Brevibacterium salitolerans TaxID=1403566 RepID=A0ABN2X692_9MICO|nr:CE1759 family FMN reductase [Brevibacterium sp.]